MRKRIEREPIASEAINAKANRNRSRFANFAEKIAGGSTVFLTPILPPSPRPVEISPRNAQKKTDPPGLAEKGTDHVR